MPFIDAVDKHTRWLMDLAQRLCGAFKEAGINYRMVGGMAVYFHVDMLDPLAARLTPGVDFAIEHDGLPRVIEAVRPLGFENGHAKGLDVLAVPVADTIRTVSHLVFVREKVRPGYLEPVPDFSEPTITQEGFLLAPVLDLVRMKLTSNRLIDKVHSIDMDGVGLITPEIENALPNHYAAGFNKSARKSVNPRAPNKPTRAQPQSVRLQKNNPASEKDCDADTSDTILLVQPQNPPASVSKPAAPCSPPL
jgi:hypothetical protein